MFFDGDRCRSVLSGVFQRLCRIGGFGSDHIRAFWVGLILAVVPIVSQPVLAGVLESCAAGCPDGWAASGVFVVGGHVADAGVQPAGVVILWTTSNSARSTLGSVMAIRCG